eukprot:6966511-Pyramimonas_sp.AAC.2
MMGKPVSRRRSETPNMPSLTNFPPPQAMRWLLEEMIPLERSDGLADFSQDRETLEEQVAELGKDTLLAIRCGAK